VKRDQYPESTGVLTADLCVHNVHCLAAEILRLHEDLKAAQRVVLSLAARVVAQSEIRVAYESRAGQDRNRD
jgi:hypothetical protein